MPVLTLLGSRVVSQHVGTRYVDAGARAWDPREGDISSRIVLRGLDTLDTNAVGDYFIRYDVANNLQLAATEAVRIVRVHADRFAAKTLRPLGATKANMGYVEHLPVHYSDDPGRRFPALIYQHGSSCERDQGVPGRELDLISGIRFFYLIDSGAWDDARPFVILSPQRCTMEEGSSAVPRMQIFLDYAISTYHLDTARLYMAGFSAGSWLTWEYARLNPGQLAAVVPMSGGGDTGAGCAMGKTPAWSFHNRDDTAVPYTDSLNTVLSINACNPVTRARFTLFQNGGHDCEQVIDLTGLGHGDPPYDPYDVDVYSWLLKHRRP
jgi:predicted peptidase